MLSKELLKLMNNRVWYKPWTWSLKKINKMLEKELKEL